MSGPSNREVADVLDRIAELFELRDANPFRVRSYRTAANEIRSLGRSVAELYRSGGREGLRALPGVGRGLSGVISEYLDTGRVALLDRLEGESSPELVFRRLPGIGPELARRIRIRGDQA